MAFTPLPGDNKQPGDSGHVTDHDLLHDWAVSAEAEINGKATPTDISSSITIHKAPTSTDHDNRYYTETEVDTALATKSASTHLHTGIYDANGAASSAQTAAAADATTKANNAQAFAVQRTNHTGSQPTSSITGFDTQVRTSTLNQMAAPTADVSLNSHKITNLTPGVASTDAATVGQITGTGNSPTGSAGGSLSGTYPNPTLSANSVDTTQVVNAAITPAKLATSVVLDSLADVTTPTPSTNDYLRWNGAAWVNVSSDTRWINLTIRAITTTSGNNLGATDYNGLITYSNTSAGTITIPQDLATFPVGASVDVINLTGSGKLSISPGGTVSLYPVATRSINAENQLTITRVATNTYYISGGLVA